MKTVRDKMIKENILLRKCSPGDNLYLRYGPNFSYGFITLVKIKTIGKNKLQIKYRANGWKKATIQKADLPDTIMVERTRKWVPSDGADAGFIPRGKQLVDGVLYEQTGNSARGDIALTSNDDTAVRAVEKLDPEILDDRYLGSFFGLAMDFLSPIGLYTEGYGQTQRHSPVLENMKTIKDSSQTKLIEG